MSGNVWPFFLCAAAAQADTIHECADASGKVTYSNTPCAPGSSTTKQLETKEPPKESVDTSMQSDAVKRQEIDFQNRRYARIDQEKREAEARRARDEFERSMRR